MALRQQAATAPARCNCAGYCNYCGRLGCVSSSCISAYARSRWAVCDECQGRGGDAGAPTICPACHMLGVIEVAPSYPGAFGPAVAA